MKIPTAWLQLKYEKLRLLIAIGGICFAVVLIFMQLGLQAALFDSAIALHSKLKGDIFLISPRSTALIAMESFSERRLYQALAFNEVLLFDEASRPEFGTITSEFKQKGIITTELGDRGPGNRKVSVMGLFKLGTSFGVDGNLITSDLNFLRIFSQRPKGYINLGVIKLKPGYDLEQTLWKMKKFYPYDVKVVSKEEFINSEKKYWNSSTPIGFIFTLGVILGLIVGIIIVYQILYANVSEHLAEYATLKAIGYKHNYLLFVVFQQSLILAILGYIPGFIVTVYMYDVAKKATLLPIGMELIRALFVMILTLSMCFISGAIAVKKLKEADPADIF